MIQRQPKSYYLSAKHHELLNEHAVNLTSLLNQPVSCRNVLEAVIILLPTINSIVLAQKVLDNTHTPRRGRKTINGGKKK
ncbi:hypothetical protein Xets_02808 [Xenorhabdus sp. TS4]|nr:hypothetical protein [Xenorhabdus sp. TS4]